MMTSLKKFGIPKILVDLVVATLGGSKAKVKIQGDNESIGDEVYGKGERCVVG